MINTPNKENRNSPTSTANRFLRNFIIIIFNENVMIKQKELLTNGIFTFESII